MTSCLKTLTSPSHGSQANYSSLLDDTSEEDSSKLLESSSSDDADLELEAMKVKLREMEAESARLKKLQHELDVEKTTGGYHVSHNSTYDGILEVDARSIYVGNVDYGATAEELEQHFSGCGTINRLTILCNKYDGSPKGFAYIEFTDINSVDVALILDDSLFRGRQLKVMPKRTNKPGISTSNHAYRRGGFVRGSYRGSGYGAVRHSRHLHHGFYAPY